MFVRITLYCTSHAEINDTTSAFTKDICAFRDDYIANARGFFRAINYSHTLCVRTNYGWYLAASWVGNGLWNNGNCSCTRGSVAEKDWHSMLVNCLSLIIIMARRGNKRLLMNRITTFISMFGRDRQTDMIFPWHNISECACDSFEFLALEFIRCEYTGLSYIRHCYLYFISITRVTRDLIYLDNYAGK